MDGANYGGEEQAMQEYLLAGEKRASALGNRGPIHFNGRHQSGLSQCTAANGAWVLPGSHKLGKVDIRKLAAVAGTERLPDAVPIICQPGDVAMTNRQALHGSFANTSKDWRVTVDFGFHRRTSVLGVRAGGIYNNVATYDAPRIRQRARLVGYGIDARRQRFPDETQFIYKPHLDDGLTCRWDDKAKEDLRDDNLLDLGI